MEWSSHLGRGESAACQDFILEGSVIFGLVLWEDILGPLCHPSEEGKDTSPISLWPALPASNLLKGAQVWLDVIIHGGLDKKVLGVSGRGGVMQQQP